VIRAAPRVDPQEPGLLLAKYLVSVGEMGERAVAPDCRAVETEGSAMVKGERAMVVAMMVLEEMVAMVSLRVVGVSTCVDTLFKPHFIERVVGCSPKLMMRSIRFAESEDCV